MLAVHLSPSSRSPALQQKSFLNFYLQMTCLPTVETLFWKFVTIAVFSPFFGSKVTDTSIFFIFFFLVNCRVRLLQGPSRMAAGLYNTHSRASCFVDKTQFSWLPVGQQTHPSQAFPSLDYLTIFTAQSSLDLIQSGISFLLSLEPSRSLQGLALTLSWLTLSTSLHTISKSVSTDLQPSSVKPVWRNCTENVNWIVSLSRNEN